MSHHHDTQTISCVHQCHITMTPKLFHVYINVTSPWHPNCFTCTSMSHHHDTQTISCVHQCHITMTPKLFHVYINVTSPWHPNYFTWQRLLLGNGHQTMLKTVVSWSKVNLVSSNWRTPSKAVLQLVCWLVSGCTLRCPVAVAAPSGVVAAVAASSGVVAAVATTLAS